MNDINKDIMDETVENETPQMSTPTEENADNDNYIIDIHGITKSFGTLQVLKGIDMKIKKGEVVSIVGPSGAGKTTLLQIIGTLDKPDSGEIVVDGVNVSRMSSNQLSEFRNKHLGFVFQFHQLLPEFTAIENIMIPAYIAGTPTHEARRRAEELLAFMGLSDRASHKPNELWQGHSSTGRRLFWPTNPQEVSTAKTRRSCTNCSSTCAHSSDRPSSSSHTMRASPPSPTAPSI